jgi:fibronectin type 3 domain-containing protein
VTLPGSGFQLAASNPHTKNGLSATFTVAPPVHQVDLSWNAPIGSPDPVAGYHVYKSSDGGNTYQLLNSAVDTGTTYEDTLVKAGQSYDYYVTSVDASGVESAPSNMIGVTIP